MDMDATPRHSSARVLGIIGLALGLLAGSIFLGMLVTVGCSEYFERGTDKTRVCDVVTPNGTPWWWAAVLWPAILFAAGQCVRRLRGHIFVSRFS